jgi:hypothetical protein
MITAGITQALKLAALQAIFAQDVIMAALFSAAANLNPQTATYSSVGEVAGSGYAAGGTRATVAPGYPQIDPASGAAVVHFNPVVFPSCTVTARGALFYDLTRGMLAIAVLNFGVDVSSVNAALTINFPSTAPPLVTLL